MTSDNPEPTCSRNQPRTWLQPSYYYEKKSNGQEREELVAMGLREKKDSWNWIGVWGKYSWVGILAIYKFSPFSIIPWEQKTIFGIQLLPVVWFLWRQWLVACSGFHVKVTVAPGWTRDGYMSKCLSRSLNDWTTKCLDLVPVPVKSTPSWDFLWLHSISLRAHWQKAFPAKSGLLAH